MRNHFSHVELSSDLLPIFITSIQKIFLHRSISFNHEWKYKCMQARLVIYDIRMRGGRLHHAELRPGP